MDDAEEIHGNIFIEFAPSEIIIFVFMEHDQSIATRSLNVALYSNYTIFLRIFKMIRFFWYCSVTACYFLQPVLPALLVSFYVVEPSLPYQLSVF